MTHRPCDPARQEARAPAAPPARWAPRLVSAARALPLAVAVLVGVVLTPTAAASARDTRAVQDAPTIEIVSPPRIVKGDEPFSVRVRVAGAPDGAVLGLAVHGGLASRGEFRATLEDDDLGGTIREPIAEPLADLTDGGPATGRAVDTAEIGFVPGETGLGRNVYPVEVELRAPGGGELARLVTYLTYVPDAVPDFHPLEVAVLADIGAPPGLRPDGETSLPPAAIDRAVQRIAAVERAGATRVTLAPVPETLEALARDDGAGADAVDRLGSLARRHPVLARPFVDVDYGALDAAGLRGEANEQAEGGADVVRDRLGVEPVGGVWLSGATWGETSARLAAQLGIGRAVVPPSAVRDGDSANLHYNPVRLGDGGPTAMISDPDLSAHLAGTDDMVAAHRFLAELAITWLEAPLNPRGVVVHLPPGGAVEPEVAGAALAALGDGQVTASVPLTQLFADTPAAPDGPADVALAPDPAGPDLSGVAPALRSARRQVTGASSLVDGPEAGARLNHSLLLATGTDTPGAERSAYVDHTAAVIADLDDAVTLPAEFRITLTARSSTIPVRLTNNLDDDVPVRVELESDQLEFVRGEVIDICSLSLDGAEGAVVNCTLPPGATSVDVPVRARTSGAFTMDVRVTSSDGSLVLDRSTFDIRSTAISGVGLILSIGAGLFLAVWWARNWHTSRRTPRSPTPPGGEGDAVGAEPDGDTVGPHAGDQPRGVGEPAVARPATGGPAPRAGADRPAPPAEPRAAASPPPVDGDPRDLADGAPYRPAHMASSGRWRAGGLSLRSAGARARRR